MSELSNGFKCTHENCKYGLSGNKSFKKEIFLQNHLKNIHEERVFQCKICDQKFAFEWQLKYHCKYCGAQFKCTSCEKIYSRPMSLVMHCKRSLHPLPDDKQFKLRKNNQTNHSYIFVPVFIHDNKLNEAELFNLVPLPLCNNSVKNKHILPKSEPCFSPNLTSLHLNELTKNIKSNKKKTSPSDSNQVFENKRSTECQTVRKRNRALCNYELKSTQTQTLHSSFDTNSNKVCHNPGPVNKKCSSFTQTLIDDIEQSDFIVKDAFLTNDMNHIEQTAQAEFSTNIDTFQLENYSTSETQTNANITDFNSQDIDSVSEGNSTFKFSDLEFIDIETQTIWNYDRTTQTENGQTLENWIMNL